MSLRRGLLAVADVRPEEGRLVVLLLVHSLFLGVPRVLTATAAMALFLDHADASSLPLVYMGAAVAIPLTGFLRLRLAARLPFRTLLAVDLAFVLACLLAFRMALGWGAAVRPVALFLPVWVEIEWVVLNLEFWGLAGHVLNIRQGKRLFGLVGAGELVSASVVGLAVPAVVGLVGTPNLLLLSAAATGACLLLVRGLARGGALPERAEDEEEEARAGVPGLLRDRYLGLVFALVGLSYLGYYFIDNAFYGFAEQRYVDADGLASFLGVFWALVAASTLLARAVLSGRLLLRYGILGGLLALPLVLGIGSGLVTLSATLGAAGALVFGLLAVTKLLDQGLRDSVDKSALLLLYQPLPRSSRVRAQTTVEGIVGPVAGGLAGVLLLGLGFWLELEPTALAGMTLGLVVLWVAVALLIRREYGEALRQALASRRLGGASMALRDASALAVLEGGLDSRHPGEVFYCLDVLEEMQYPGLGAALVRLLDHANPEVRRQVLARIERLEPGEALGAVRQRVFAEDEPEVRGMALRALGALGEADELERLYEALDAESEPERRGALVGLLRHGGIEGILSAGERLVAAARADEAARRLFAARVIGEVGVSSFYRPLQGLLRDPDHGVRTAALASAARLGNARLWPFVIEGLDEPGVRSAAAAALLAGGEEVAPLLEEAFAAALARSDRSALRRLARLLGQSPGPRPGEFLWRHAGHADLDVRLALLTALVSRGFRASPGQRPVAEERLADEVDAATGMLASVDDLAAHEDAALLRASLRQSVELVRERVFCLLSVLHAPEAIQRARANLRGSSPERRAQAVELIDSLLSPALTAIVVPLIEDLPDEERLTRLRGRFTHPPRDVEDRLREVMEDGASAWLRACALHTAGAAGLEALARPARERLSDPDPLVRETAAWALAQLAPGRPGPAINLEAEALVERFASSLGPGSGGKPMLSTVEKVIILKGVSIFSETPDEVLAEVASLLEEVEVEAGQPVFEKGDMGTAMYVVVEGHVRVHDGDRTLRELGSREIFGEMAALDPEPRSASVSATRPTHLFRLDQDALYELMADRIEVVRGVIRVLCHRLRAWTN